MVDDGARRPARTAERSGSTKKIGSGLLALSSAAVLTVYAAGYVKTRPAAERFAVAERRPNPAPAPPAAPAPSPVVAMASANIASSRPAVPAAAAKPAPPKTARRTPKLPAAKATAPAAAVDPLPQAAPPPAPVTPAPEPAPAADAKPAEPAPAARPVLKDGTYSGWGTSRHGDIQASVVIEGGRIVSANITQCLTRYSCSWIEHLPGQIVTRQSPECDFVSGATQSTNAFYYAIVEALAKAK